MASLRARIAPLLPDLVAIRHDLHAHPELGYEERRTSEVVQRELSTAGIEFRAGLAGGTGVLGYLPATVSGAPTIALRADMDALPIEERTGLAYSSKHAGKMHACGHDGHTTVLLGTAQALRAEPERRNNVLFLFQPAEEGGAGGKRMVEDGVLSGKVFGQRADMIFGLHGFPNLHVGTIATRTGAMMASADELRIRVYGKGAHAAMPHTGLDPMVAASHIILGLQSVASRSVSPLDSVVVTIASVHGGLAHNVIPEVVDLRGTLRTLREDTRTLAQERIKAIVEHTARAYGATAEIEFGMSYPVTVNDAEAADRFRGIAAGIDGITLGDDVQPTMGAEDFSFYGAETKACFYWLGLLPEGQSNYPNLHAPEFDFNDDAIAVGVEAMSALALAPL